MPRFVSPSTSPHASPHSYTLFCVCLSRVSSLVHCPFAAARSALGTLIHPLVSLATEKSLAHRDTLCRSPSPPTFYRTSIRSRRQTRRCGGLVECLDSTPGCLERRSNRLTRLRSRFENTNAFLALHLYACRPACSRDENWASVAALVEELGLTALLRAQAIARAAFLSVNTTAAAGAAAEIVGRAGHVGAEEELAGHLRTQQAIHTGPCERHIARQKTRKDGARA